jgi:hypothetical protein
MKWDGLKHFGLTVSDIAKFDGARKKRGALTINASVF